MFNFLPDAAQRWQWLGWLSAVLAAACAIGAMWLG